MGTPWRTALRPPTMTNSTRASTNRRISSLAKSCILQCLLHEESPSLVLPEPLLRRQRQHQVEQGIIDVSLVPAIITDFRRGSRLFFHGYLLDGLCRPAFLYF